MQTPFPLQTGFGLRGNLVSAGIYLRFDDQRLGCTSVADQELLGGAGEAYFYKSDNAFTLNKGTTTTSFQ